MKIEQVAEKVHQLRMKIMEHGRNPKIAVYMSARFHYKCMSEIRGQVPPEALELYEKSQILGFPVYEICHRDNHPDFRVIEI